MQVLQLEIAKQDCFAILAPEFPYESHLWRRTGGVLREIVNLVCGEQLG